MKKSMMVVAMVLMFGLTACGTDTEIVYVEKPVANASENADTSNEVLVNAPPVAVVSSFNIDPILKVQRLVQSLDELGNINNLQGIGTMEYKPENVVSVMYVSKRQFFETMPVVDASEKSISLIFEGTINNDSPQIIFLMDDGEQYPVDMRTLKFNSSEPIRFLAREWGFEYGHQEETRVIAIKNVDNSVNFDVFFGCDELVGLPVDVDPNSIGGVAWELEDGTLYPAIIMTNEFGSYYARVTDVPLVENTSETSYWMGPSTTGRLVVFSKNGLRIPFLGAYSGFYWEYYTDNTIQYQHPYWGVDGKEDILKFYIPIEY